jgi:hypothetical protein
MAAEARQSRVDEITSDLWESAHDCSSQNDCDLRCAAQMLLRTAIGAPSDLLWRCEHASIVYLRRWVVAATFAIAAAAAVWTYLTLRIATLPQPAPLLKFVSAPAPPPPPPPPPPDDRRLTQERRDGDLR